MERAVWVFVVAASLTACSGAGTKASTGVDGAAQLGPEHSSVAATEAVAGPESAAQRAGIELHPVAVRHGQLDLVAGAAGAHLIMTGEPLALEPGQPPRRSDGFGRGLLADDTQLREAELVAFAGDPSAGPSRAWVVLDQDLGRNGVELRAYRMGREGWAKQAPDGLLLGYHDPLVELPGGAVLGLRRYAQSELPDAEIGSDAWDREMERFEAALTRAPQGFALLAGRLEVLPQVPEDLDIVAAVATASGGLVALAHAADPEQADRAALLSWPVGQATAQQRELPGGREPPSDWWNRYLGHQLHLVSVSVSASASAGAGVLLFGQVSGDDGAPQPFLAHSEGGSEWRLIPFASPSSPAQAAIAAALDESGALWLATDSGELWRTQDHRAATPSWVRVELPSVGSPAAADPYWYFDELEGWREVDLPATIEALAPTQLLAAEGELWVVASADDGRRVLLSTAASEQVELPGVHALEVERRDRDRLAQKARPGGKHCYQFSAVLVDDPEGAGQAEAGRVLGLGGDALLEARPMPDDDADVGDAFWRYIYIGELDGTRQLVVEGSADEPKLAQRMAETLGEVAGVEVRIDCRVRRVLRMAEMVEGAS